MIGVQVHMSRLKALASIPLSPQPKRKSSAFLAEGDRFLRGGPVGGGEAVRWGSSASPGGTDGGV